MSETTIKPISVAYVRILNEPLPKMCSMCMKDLTGIDNIITSMGKYVCFECYGHSQGEVSEVKDNA